MKVQSAEVEWRHDFLPVCNDRFLISHPDGTRPPAGGDRPFAVQAIQSRLFSKPLSRPCLRSLPVQTHEFSHAVESGYTCFRGHPPAHCFSRIRYPPSQPRQVTWRPDTQPAMNHDRSTAINAPGFRASQAAASMAGRPRHNRMMREP